MDISFNMLGEKDLVRVMDQLPKAMHKRVMNTAVREGARIVLAAAKANLTTNNNIKTGLLRRSLKVKVKAYQNKGVVWAGIGADPKVVGTTQQGRRIRPSNYIHFVEFAQTRDSSIDARPFLRPAIDHNQDRAFKKMFEGTKKGLEREVKRLNRAGI